MRPYIDMHSFCPHVHGKHIINTHRRHTNHALTLKCITHNIIWTSGGISIDCLPPICILSRMETTGFPEFPTVQPYYVLSCLQWLGQLKLGIMYGWGDWEYYKGTL